MYYKCVSKTYFNYLTTLVTCVSFVLMRAVGTKVIIKEQSERRRQ